ncbi:hypothetical protein M758_UG069800 [Ceratodon purpureus]|nr:hypothetical protein M758_UG069800 [Ceratodon purpureus]
MYPSNQPTLAKPVTSFADLGNRARRKTFSRGQYDRTTTERNQTVITVTIEHQPDQWRGVHSSP